MAKDICMKWGRMIVQLYAKEEYGVKVFKFQTFTPYYIFSQIGRFRPPVLWRTRQFEHRHCTFPGYIERSNKKNVNSWSIQREILFESVSYLFGEFVTIKTPTIQGTLKRLKNGDPVRILDSTGKNFFGIFQESVSDMEAKNATYRSLRGKIVLFQACGTS